MVRLFSILFILLLESFPLTLHGQTEPSERVDLALIKEISGNINPQDVVFSPKGSFFVPNSASHHTISVYDRTFFKVKDIEDELFLSDYFFTQYKGPFQGAPYKGVASSNGDHIWIANRFMKGKGFTNPAYENCFSPAEYDPSFIYKVNAETYQIQSVLQVGSMPTNMAVSPNGRYLVVSNWCSGDVSVIDTEIEIEKYKIPLGENPGGVCINSSSTKAYIALTGEHLLLEIDLRRGSTSRFIFRGRTPYSVQLGPSDRFLYVSYFKEGEVGKIDLKERKVVSKVETGKWAKEILLSPNGRYLYVLDTKKPSVTKLRTHDMTIVQQIELPEEPRGMDLDPISSHLWVAMESGIRVFEDISMNGVRIYTPNPFVTREDTSGYREVDVRYEEEARPKDLARPTNSFHIIIGSYQSQEVAAGKKAVVEALGYKDCSILTSSSGHYRLSIKSFDDLTQASKELPLFQMKFDPDAWILDARDEHP